MAGETKDDEIVVDVPRRWFPFANDARVRPLSLLFGAVGGRAGVELSGLTLRARFGPWSIETPLDNVERAEITGPYHWLRVAGPARWSAEDHGITFATTTERGVELHFYEPVPGLDPWGLMRHPNLTVTVARPEDLLEAIDEAIGDAERIERDEHDQLQGMTAHELRALARQHGIPRASTLKKDELIDALQPIIE